jgi:hypothetical protein
MLLPVLLAPALIFRAQSNVTPQSGNSTEQGKKGHVEFIPPTFEKHSEQTLISPGVWQEYVDVGGSLKGSPPEKTPLITYANKLGPYQPFEFTVEMKTLSPAKHPLTVVIIMDGKATWASAFEPQSNSEYIIAKSPVFKANGSSIEIVIANDNDVTVTYTSQIILIYH